MQPAADVPVTVYVVVTVGLAITFAADGSSNPVIGLHTYETAPEASNSTDPDPQILTGELGLVTVRLPEELTAIVIEALAELEQLSNTVTV